MAAPLRGGLSVSHTLVHKSRHFKSDNKDTCRCFNDGGLLHCICFASEGLRHCRGDGRPSMFLLCECVILCVSDKALADIKRERESIGQSRPLCISRRAVWVTISTSIFGGSATCIMLVSIQVGVTVVASRRQWPPNLNRKWLFP